MKLQLPKLNTRLIVFAVLPALAVTGFFVFADPIQKTSVTAPVESGLVGYWSFNEGSGQIASDGSVNGNNGQLGSTTASDAGDPQWVSGKVGGALQFDGDDDYVDVGDPDVLKITGAITLAGWVKINDLLDSHQFFGRGQGLGTPGNRGYAVSYYDGIQKIYFDTYSSGGIRDALVSTSLLNDNDWHYIVATWDGTTGAGGKKLYIDSQLDNQGTSTISAIGTPGYNFLIGRSPSGGWTYINGLIDEVRVYDRALTAEEVLQNYNASKRTVLNTSMEDRWTDGLVGYWSFNGQDIEGSNATATDLSSNNNDGTITGAVPAPGKVGQALSFDGDGDVVNCGVASELNFTTEDFSIELWYKPTADGNDDMLFDRGTWATGGYRLQHYANQKVYFRTFQSGSYPSADTTSNALTLNEWNHIVAVRTGITATIYINGTDKTYVSSVDNPTSISINARIGGRISADSTANGLIDEVRIYNRALSATEVAEHYQGGMRRMEIQE